MADLTITITAKDGASQTFRAVGQSAAQMSRDIQQAGQSADAFQTFEQRVQGLDTEITRVGTALTAFGAATTAAAAVGVAQFASLEAAMTNVGTIAGQSQEWLDGMTTSVRELAVELGTSPTGLAEGLYDIIGSGIDAADALDVLETSAIAARAGLTDTGTAAQAITAILNAYGMEASEAGDVSDVLFATVDRGVISFEQLSRNLGNTIPLASQLGVSIEELGAAYAELTVNGVQASQAETQIAALMRATLNETEALTEAVQEYGYASAEALISAEGLAGFLEFLAEASGGSSAALIELLGTAEAMNAALILGANEGAGYAAMIGEIGAAAQDGEYTLGVFEQQMQTTQAALDRMGAALTELGITVGAALAPGVTAAADAVSGLAGAINGLPGPLQTVAALSVTAAGGVSLMAGAFLLALPRIVETRAALQALGGMRGVIGLLGAAINPVTLALVGVTAAGIGLHSMLTGVSEEAEKVATNIAGLNDEIERLRLEQEGGLADQLQEIVTELEALQDLNTVPLEELVDFLNLPADTTLMEILGGPLRNELDETMGSLDEFTDHITKVYNSLSSPEAKAAYLGYVEDMLGGIESTVEGTNLDDIIAEVITTPASEIPEVMAAIEESTTGAASGVGILGDAISSQMGTVDDAQARLGEYIVANEEYFTALGEAVEGFHASMQEWLADGDNILTFLQSMGELADREFRLSLDIMDTGAALDQVLRTFEQIDSLGQRSSAAGAIMDALFGPGGDPNDAVGPLRDLFDVGRISAEQFYETIDHGVAIQYRAAEAEALLNEIRVDQVPLLREQQDAYVDNLEALTQLGPAEQRRALMLQDTAVQAQLAEYASLAYAASVGEIPEAVATDVILNAAEADAGMKDLLLQLGLIEEVDGEIRVAFPEADATIQALDRVSRLMLEIEARAAGVDSYQLAVEILGEEEARQLWGLMDENDGRTAEAAVNVDTLGGDLLAALLGDLDMVDGRTAEAAVNTTTTGTEDVQQVSDDVTELDGKQANATVVGTVVNAEAIGDVFTLLRSIEETGAATLSVTVDVDMSALNPFGLGFSDGGGAAGFTPMQASIDVVIGQNALDDFTVPTFDPVMIDVATDGALLALENLNGVANAAREATALGVSITVNAPGSDIVKGALDDVTAAANTANESDPNVAVSITGAGVAVGSLDLVTAAAGRVEGSDPSVSVAVSGAGAAVAELNAVAAAAANVSGTYTAYVNTVRTQTYQTIGTPFGPYQHGGIPGYAHGGVPFIAGEAGPEIAHFAGGGTAMLPHHGLYMAPPMTYVSPSNTYDSSDRSQGITVNINGGNFYGMEDVAAQVAQHLVPAMAEENRRHRAAQGVMA